MIAPMTLAGALPIAQPARGPRQRRGLDPVLQQQRNQNVRVVEHRLTPLPTLALPVNASPGLPSR